MPKTHLHLLRMSSARIANFSRSLTDMTPSMWMYIAVAVCFIAAGAMITYIYGKNLSNIQAAERKAGSASASGIPAQLKDDTILMLSSGALVIVAGILLFVKGVMYP